MTQVRIEDASGTVRATIPLVAAEIERTGVLENARARLTIARDDLNDISALAPGEDRVYLEDGGTDIFGGVLKTPGRAGARPQLLVDSFAVLMDRAQSTPLGDEKTGVDDSALIQECIDATPGLTAGTIQTVQAGQTWIFSGISQLAKARKVAEAAGAELVFNADQTVDYLAQRGSDKTGTTLSPANESFDEGTFTADVDGLTGNVTHLEVFGVGQGASQASAAIVPADDTASYPRYDVVRTYTNSDWADGDDKRWGQRTNKDLKNADAVASWGETLISDLRSVERTVEAVVKGTTVNLGDRFHITHPEEGVDHDLRATSVTTLIKADGGTAYETTFSSFDGGGIDLSAEVYKNSGRYDQAYEGDLTQIQQGPGRGPVDASRDYIISVYYPDDVVHEVNSQLLVSGLPYRAYSSGAANNPAFNTAASQSVQSGSATISGDDVWTTILSIDPASVGSQSMEFYAFVQAENETYTGPIDIPVRLSFDFGNEGYWPDPNGTPLPTLPTGTALELEEKTRTFDSTLAGDYSDLAQLELEAKLNFTSSDSVDVLGQLFVRFNDTHTHPPEPGVSDFDGSDASPAHYPDSVDIVVNGASEGVSLGDGTGPFEEVVDLSTSLTPGWNTIALTSDGIGHLDATFSADLFRQSL